MICVMVAFNVRYRPTTARKIDFLQTTDVRLLYVGLTPAFTTRCTFGDAYQLFDNKYDDGGRDDDMNDHDERYNYGVEM